MGVPWKPLFHEKYGPRAVERMETVELFEMADDLITRSRDRRTHREMRRVWRALQDRGAVQKVRRFLIEEAC
ncbi:MAG: hypothetical protein AAF618_00300 [Pseudomonadota bacterium]